MMITISVAVDNRRIYATLEISQYVLQRTIVLSAITSGKIDPIRWDNNETINLHRSAAQSESRLHAIRVINVLHGRSHYSRIICSADRYLGEAVTGVHNIDIARAYRVVTTL